MPAYSRPATGAPPVEQLSRKFPKHPPTTAIIGNSQTRYLHRHFNPHDRATPAIITIRGASTFDIDLELASYGLDESLRRLRRLVNNTLRTRQELERLVVSCVLPRYPNQRLERSNEQFVHRFNREARQFNETVKAYCRRPSKVSYVDYQFEQLPPRRFLAADGLHPSFMGVPLIAETLKSALGRGDLEATTGWSTQPTAPVNIRSSQQNTHDTNHTYQHVPGAPHPPNITAEFPTIGETVTPARPKHPLTIINSAPLLGGKSAGQPRRAPLLRTARPEELHGNLPNYEAASLYCGPRDRNSQRTQTSCTQRSPGAQRRNPPYNDEGLPDITTICGLHQCHPRTQKKTDLQNERAKIDIAPAC
ncbi:hypothetical protein HPB52_023124 [Rhipicephalus sanguineus]|uniref:Uncharacterized protein n=1 Tax=Rhipicephalus sanguineus TaxID=34632 RepID=A0A9D4QGA4_RHISA|nr:hypothetical protein HPB52_023124 [Rhipicephalus sanguineus]